MTKWYDFPSSCRFNTSLQRKRCASTKPSPGRLRKATFDRPCNGTESGSGQATPGPTGGPEQSERHGADDQHQHHHRTAQAPHATGTCQEGNNGGFRCHGTSRNGAWGTLFTFLLMKVDPMIQDVNTTVLNVMQIPSWTLNESVYSKTSINHIK